MNHDITKEALEFLLEAKEAFEKDVFMKTYRNEAETLIALRRGFDTTYDSIQIYELGKCVGNFLEQIRNDSYEN